MGYWIFTLRAFCAWFLCDLDLGGEVGLPDGSTHTNSSAGLETLTPFASIFGNCWSNWWWYFCVVGCCFTTGVEGGAGGGGGGRVDPPLPYSCRYIFCFVCTEGRGWGGGFGKFFHLLVPHHSKPLTKKFGLERFSDFCTNTNTSNKSNVKKKAIFIIFHLFLQKSKLSHSAVTDHVSYWDEFVLVSSVSSVFGFKAENCKIGCFVNFLVESVLEGEKSLTFWILNQNYDQNKQKFWKCDLTEFWSDVS